MATAATGAAMGQLFAKFLDLVMYVHNSNSEFEPSLKRLGDMLKDLQPNLQRIQAFSGGLDSPGAIERLTELVSEGEDLARKCSTIKRYNIFKKPRYNSKIKKLAESISEYITITMGVHQSGDVKEILFDTKTILFNLQQLLGNQFNEFNMGSGNMIGVCSPPSLEVNPVGLKIPLQDLKIKLLKDDQVSMIVLSAPGGCGKTTLAKTLCQDHQVKGKFKDNIFFVTVSKTPCLQVIVENLFQHINKKVPVFQSEEDAVSQLGRLLRQIKNPTLLVLDDVWSGSESLLDKLKFGIENYKILVTSRSQLPRFGYSYKLQTLNFTDAMTLFHQSAFLPDNNSYIPDQETMSKIVEHCKGFPLAISVTGKSLCGQPASVWFKRLKKSSKTSAILSDAELFKCLQSSVDALEDEILKECYMDLGSFPEDQKIPAAALVDMWVELYNLDEDDAFFNLYELSCRNLLDLYVIRKCASEDEDSHAEHFVMQHDILRELAILQSNSGSIERRKRLFVEIHGNEFPEWLTKPKQRLSAKLLSISTDDQFASKWLRVQAPDDVETLILNIRTKQYTLPEFIEKMENLKVLMVNNHGSLPAELSNFDLLGSSSSLKRIRLEKVSIPSTTTKFENLVKISLVMCNIGQAFSNSDTKISAAFPSLAEINISYCSDLVELPAGFCDLIQLKRLSISNCYKLSRLPEELGGLVKMEILRLNSCSNLLGLPQTIARLGSLKILDLSDCLSIKELPEQIGELHSLRKLYMIDCPSCLPSSVTKLVNLKEVTGDYEMAKAWKDFKPHLPSLIIKEHKDDNLNWLR